MPRLWDRISQLRAELGSVSIRRLWAQPTTVLGRRIRAGFLSVLLILFINGVVIYQSMQTLIENIDFIAESNLAVTSIERVLSVLKDAETAQRGYLLTEDAEYLALHEAAAAEVAQGLDQLELALLSHPLTYAHLPALREHVAQRLTNLDDVIVVRQEQGLAAAQAIIGTGQGKEQMEAVRELIVVMKAEEGRLLRQRADAAQQSSQRAIFSFILVTLIDLGLLLLVYVLVVRNYQGHNQAQQAAQRYTERLQSLSRELLLIQEYERRDIARELHDQIGQILTAVKITLHAFQRNPQHPEAGALLDDAVENVDQALHHVRDLSLSLRPLLLDDLGLVAALRWHIDRQAQRTGLLMHFELDTSDTRFPPEIETACFRIVQEALTNIIRYAQAEAVTVALRQRPERLELSVADDGVGFDLHAAQQRPDQPRSQGLLGMQERVSLAGGALEISTAPGEGTHITAWFPLRPPAEAG